MTTDKVQAILNHSVHSRQYFENAGNLLQQGEAGKAGELFWGSLAQAFHALAAYLGREVKSHRDLKNFVIQLSRDQNEVSIVEDFVLAENLHFNFYDVQQTVEDISLVLPRVERLRQRAFSLIPRELLPPRVAT